MTVVCPSGHTSTATDYCDQCGLLIAERGPAPDHPTVDLPELDEVDTSAAAPTEPCPACHALRSGDDRYCEACGHDFLAPPASAVAWEAVATADRDQFERVASAGLRFPDDYGERRFALNEEGVRIGRGRSRTGEVPEIDLSGSPEDPGISRPHAILERQEDGGYSLRDLDSTNGTTVNGDSTPVSTEVGIPLGEGDRIHLGAWTTITLRARGTNG